MKRRSADDGRGICTWTAYAEKCSRTPHESSSCRFPLDSASGNGNDEWTSGFLFSMRVHFLIGFGLSAGGRDNLSAKYIGLSSAYDLSSTRSSRW